MLTRKDYEAAIDVLREAQERYLRMREKALEDSVYADGPAYSQDRAFAAQYSTLASQCFTAMKALMSLMPAREVIVEQAA
ncbi:hypothetical protein D3C78_1156250 [compost metagenome]